MLPVACSCCKHVADPLFGHTDHMHAVHIDVSYAARTTLLKWLIHGTKQSMCAPRAVGACRRLGTLITCMQYISCNKTHRQVQCAWLQLYSFNCRCSVSGGSWPRSGGGAASRSAPSRSSKGRWEASSRGVWPVQWVLQLVVGLSRGVSHGQEPCHPSSLSRSAR